MRTVRNDKCKTMTNSARSIEQGVPRRFKILLPAITWTLVAFVLFYRSTTLLLNYNDHLLFKIFGSVILGIFFYLLLFFKISFKNSRLTINLTSDKPHSILFFDVKRDLLITVIAISGFLLRVSGILTLENVSILYIATGIPLLLSTLRYYYYGTFYDELNRQKK